MSHNFSLQSPDDGLAEFIEIVLRITENWVSKLCAHILSCLFSKFPFWVSGKKPKRPA